MAHGDARERNWRGNWRMGWVASTLHITSEHGVSSITAADAHTSAASSRMNWRPRRFKWICPFRRKTKSGFCACAITFQTQSTAFRCPPLETVLSQFDPSSRYIQMWLLLLLSLPTEPFTKAVPTKTLAAFRVTLMLAICTIFIFLEFCMGALRGMNVHHKRVWNEVWVAKTECYKNNSSTECGYSYERLEHWFFFVNSDLAIFKRLVSFIPHKYLNTRNTHGDARRD